MNVNSISSYINEDVLDTLLSLEQFLIKQRLSLSDMDRNDYTAIQLLYNIARDIFGDACPKESAAEKIEDVCSKTISAINMTKQDLVEGVKDEASQKRMLEFLDDDLITIERNLA